VKQFIILGSTGSIGTSSLDVIETNPGQFKVAGLVAGTSADLMIEQVRKFKPKAVSMNDHAAAKKVHEAVGGKTRVYAGYEGMLELIEDIDADAAINGLVGSVGLMPTLTALESGMDVLLANKETIVMGGPLVMETARRTGKRIVPIDSEMSAIYQCIKGEKHEGIKRLILTASGGPFVDFKKKALESVTLEQALKHPTWAMGTKNTIDSATLMNKGLEVIEASCLFDIPGDRIDVTIHRSSVAHSFVEFIDGSLLCQVSDPDMRLAIQYSMTDPLRLPSEYGGLDFTKPFSLAFEPPDIDRFPCLGLAFRALELGGTAPAVMNGANEQAVESFVDGLIRFQDIPDLVSDVMENHTFIENPTVEELIGTDKESKRTIAAKVRSRVR